MSGGTVLQLRELGEAAPTPALVPAHPPSSSSSFFFLSSADLTPPGAPDSAEREASASPGRGGDLAQAPPHPHHQFSSSSSSSSSSYSSSSYSYCSYPANPSSSSFSSSCYLPASSHACSSPSSRQAEYYWLDSEYSGGGSGLLSDGLDVDRGEMDKYLDPRQSLGAVVGPFGGGVTGGGVGVGVGGGGSGGCLVSQDLAWAVPHHAWTQGHGHGHAPPRAYFPLTSSRTDVTGSAVLPAWYYAPGAAGGLEAEAEGEGEGEAGGGGCGREAGSRPPKADALSPVLYDLDSRMVLDPHRRH